MTLRRRALFGVSLLTGFLLICRPALAAKSYPDRVGDVKAGTGPDVASTTVSNTKTMVTFRVRFARSPPLRVSQSEGWVDMLLLSVDVPPLGPQPLPGGAWRGADFALGTHGPSNAGLMVRLGQGKSRQVTRFKIVTSGSTLTFSIPCRALGNPGWFAFGVAAAREMNVETSGNGHGADFAPARGTFRYTLTN